MNETKLVRNSSGKDITVEYGGRHYRFDAGSERHYPADLADVAQYRHGHEGLCIAFPEDTTSPPTDAPSRDVPESTEASAAPAETPNEPAPAESPSTAPPATAPAPPASAPRKTSAKAPAKAKEKKTR